MRPDDDTLRRIFEQTKVIALVGASDNPLRASYFVGRYLAERGYRVIGVNPKLAGQRLFGETVRAGLGEVGGEVDMIDLFRRSDAVPPIVDEALALWPRLATVWMQIGVRHAGAAGRAEAQGATVVQDLCPKQEHQRLYGDLRKGGIVTGIVSSKLPRL